MGTPERDHFGPLIGSSAERGAERDSAPGAHGPARVIAGRFLLEARIGTGRYGDIYRALDRNAFEDDPNARVALQIVSSEMLERDQFLSGFKDGFLRLQSWSHPNIVKLLELGRDGAKLFSIMELLEGASLRCLLRECYPEALNHEESLAVIRDVASALKHAHARGVVHGDVRAGNVMVTDDYTVKLLDFVPIPFAPGVHIDDPHASLPVVTDTREDIYRLACLAYELFSGRHPYGGSLPEEALRAGLTPEPVDGMPLWQWQALRRGLALVPDYRPSTVDELMTELGVSGTERLSPTAPPPPSPAEEPVTERPVRAAESSPQPVRQARVERARPPHDAPPSAATETRAPRTPARDQEMVLAAERRRPVEEKPRRSFPYAWVSLIAVIAAAVFAYLNYAPMRETTAEVLAAAGPYAQNARESFAGLMEGWGLGEDATEQPAPLPNDTASRESTPQQAGRPAEDQPTAENSGGVRTAALDTIPETDNTSASAREPGTNAADAGTPTAAPADDTADQGAAQTLETADAVDSVPAENEAAENADGGAAAAETSPSDTPPEPSGFAFITESFSVSESAGAARVAIERRGAVDEPAQLVWWAASGSAVGEEDFADLGRRIETFSPGERERTIYVPIVADSLPESTEIFTVRAGLRPETGNQVVVTMEAEVSIVDDDF